MSSHARLLLAAAALTVLAQPPAQAAHKKHRASSAASAASAPATLPVILPTADTQQLADADRALYGHYACEFKQSVELQRDTANPGYVDLAFKGKVWIMKPVLSSTGALRVEDTHGEMLFLQTAYKSMLMDVKTGHRVVDACVHPSQLAAQSAGTGKDDHILY